VNCWEIIIGNIDSTTCIPIFGADDRAVTNLSASVAAMVARSTGVPSSNRFVVAVVSALFRIAAWLKNGSAFSCIILAADVMLFLISIHFLFFSS
jgi:hypothetical protein